MVCRCGAISYVPWFYKKLIVQPRLFKEENSFAPIYIKEYSNIDIEMDINYHTFDRKRRKNPTGPGEFTPEPRVNHSLRRWTLR